MWKAWLKFVEDEIEIIQTYRPYNLTTNQPTKSQDSSSKPKSKSVNQVKQSKNPPSTSTTLHSDPNIKKNQQKFGPCPVCKKYHTWKGKCGEKASSKLSDCDVWSALDVEARGQKIIDAKGC